MTAPGADERGTSPTTVRAVLTPGQGTLVAPSAARHIIGGTS